jgi:hypothetical protein
MHIFTIFTHPKESPTPEKKHPHWPAWTPTTPDQRRPGQHGEEQCPQRHESDHPQKESRQFFLTTLKFLNSIFVLHMLMWVLASQAKGINCR